MKTQQTFLGTIIGLLCLTAFLSPLNAQTESSPKGYPVLGPLHDTIFVVYNKIGSFAAEERAARITQKIAQLYEDDFLQTDSIAAIVSEGDADILYKDLIIMTVTRADARLAGDSVSCLQLAQTNAHLIQTSIEEAKNHNYLTALLKRIGLILLILAGAGVVFWGILFCFRRLIKLLVYKKYGKLKKLTYKGYQFLSAKQIGLVLTFAVNMVKWLIIAFTAYFMLMLLFSIFPFTRHWADYLLSLTWSPCRQILVSIWHYLPNLFTIVIIVLIFKYLIRFIKYLFTEIASERLKLSGFYADWAMPTFQIIRLFLIVFALVMIFPYMPGKSSPAFQGISIFVGVLVSLGSSSAIANAIAGLVITYMRPFTLGDRIKIGDISGDVIEKNILVTRVKTIKNEEITIPNLTILQGNTINYSIFAKEEGLIVYTSVTMGYDYEWQKIHKALIDAALMTENILSVPKPFVLQQSLDDFYVTYQLNCYTREANGQAKIYSDLHQNIQDVFNERGLEGVSPHYRASRDGNALTFPPKYSKKQKNKKDE